MFVCIYDLCTHIGLSIQVFHEFSYIHSSVESMLA